MDSRQKSVPPLIPPKSQNVLNKHLSQPNLQLKKPRSTSTSSVSNESSTAVSQGKTRNHHTNNQPLNFEMKTIEAQDEKGKGKLMNVNNYCTTSLPRRKSSIITHQNTASKSKTDQDLQLTQNNPAQSQIRNDNGNFNFNFTTPTQKSKSLNGFGQSQSPLPLVISTHISLPVKLSKMSIHGGSKPTESSIEDVCDVSMDLESTEKKDTECQVDYIHDTPVMTPGSEIKILINDVEPPNKDIEALPRRPLKRKSQDHDRNFLSEYGEYSSRCGGTNSDFWLPKVKVTPSMVNQLNAEILANIHVATVVSSSSKTGQDKLRFQKIMSLLQEFLLVHGFLGPHERINDAIETISTRILNPSDDELWSILTSDKIVNIKCCFVPVAQALSDSALRNVRVLGSFQLSHVRRILTDPDLSLAYLVGPDIEIVTGDSAKTEKLISSIVVAALRAHKSESGLGISMAFTNNDMLPENDKNNETNGMDLETHSQLSQTLQSSTPATSNTSNNNHVNAHHNQKTTRLSAKSKSPQFLEVAHVPTLEVPTIRDAFKLLPLPSGTELKIFHSSAVVVRFEEMASEIEVPVRIQVAAEGNDFRASILKLSGCTLTFCNPVRSFFTYNPGDNLMNIDVSNIDNFSVKRIESPKPHSLLMIHRENFYILETGGASVADDIFQRISGIQRNAASGYGKQVAHIFITGQSLLAFKLHTYENLFEIPLMNIVKLHNPTNQSTTCILELESTEAMDFISADSPSWAITFTNLAAKENFEASVFNVIPSLKVNVNSTGNVQTSKSKFDHPAQPQKK